MKFDNSDLEHLSDTHTAQDDAKSKQPSPSPSALKTRTGK